MSQALAAFLNLEGNETLKKQACISTLHALDRETFNEALQELDSKTFDDIWNFLVSGKRTGNSQPVKVTAKIAPSDKTREGIKYEPDIYPIIKKAGAAGINLRGICTAARLDYEEDRGRLNTTLRGDKAMRDGISVSKGKYSFTEPAKKNNTLEPPARMGEAPQPKEQMTKTDIIKYIIENAQIAGSSKPYSEVVLKSGQKLEGLFVGFFIGGNMLATLVWANGKQIESVTLNVEEIATVKAKA